MKKNPRLIIPAVVVGVLLLIVAVVYWVQTAQDLPGFFPGHQAGDTEHHTKHGIAAALLGAGCLVFAWFQSGPAARA